MPLSDGHICRHCGITFCWRPQEHTADDGAVHLFCCRGCLGAYLLVCGAGLGEFYRRGDRGAPTVHDEAALLFSGEELAPFLTPDGEFCRIELVIGGISCPSCVWLLERVIAAMEGVAAVSLTYSGSSASVRFNPALTSAADILATVARLGYAPRPYSPEISEQAARRERNDLLLRLGTALFLSMQLMAYSFALYAGYFQGIGREMKSLLQLLSLAVATPVVFYCGWPFFRGARQGLAARMPGMDLLIAVGTGAAWLYSLFALLLGRETYFESAAMIVTCVLLGRLMELSVRQRAMSGVEALYSAAPQRATLIEPSGAREVAAGDVRGGDRLLVRQGGRFPVDVRIEQGETEIDQSLVTGEVSPVAAGPGDEVRAGSINVGVAVTVLALRPAGQSYVMRVAALVRMAQAEKPAVQRLVDRVAVRFVPGVILLAAVVFISQLIRGGGGSDQPLLTALSVVLIACPCALGLAVPTAVLAACSRCASQGVILRSGDVIERLAGIDSVLLDKTGTVTAGRPQVVHWGAVEGFDERLVLHAAATVEHPAAHPLARAIEQCARRQGVERGACLDFTIIPGRGVSGRLADGRGLLCGSPRYLMESGVDLTPLPEIADTVGTVVLLAVAGRVAGHFLLSDPLREGGRGLAASLAAGGIESWLVSGDAEPVVARTAGSLGLNRARFGMTPAMKLELVRSLQQAGRRVLMAGDGVNDAPALAAANVSCSIAGSSDIALENADLIISGRDLGHLAWAQRLARRTMSVIRQNLLWAFLYNIIGIPLAIYGVLTPVYAAAAMTLSSLMVSLNSLRLMRMKHHG